MHRMIESAARSLTGRVLIALMLTVAAQPAISSACTKLAYAGIAADVVTTVGGVESGRGSEANPIYPDGQWFYPTLGALAIARAYAVHRFSQWRTPVPIRMERKDGSIETVYGIKKADGLNCLIAGTALAAAGNNAAVWAGGGDRARIGGAAAGIGLATITWRFGD